MNFMTKMGKNKYNMIGWWIKKSQHSKKTILQQFRPKP